LEDVKITKIMTVKNLISACEDLFSQWKRIQKERKKVPVDEVEKLIDQAEIIHGTDIKIVTGLSTFEATSAAGFITKEGNYIAHIFDGNVLVSMASENVDIDLRKIAPEIGKVLGGSGGGRPKMTQCGGPNKNKAKDALELAKKLTIKILEK
jgi:alanyl-tRNA synthetase